LAGVIVLDANVLIAHFDVADAHHERATAVLLDAAAEPLAASPLTLAEVLVGPARAGTLTAARRALDDLGVQQIALGSDAAHRLAGLRAETRLKLPDCCVLLAAKDAPAEAIATFDDGLALAAERLGLAVR
jgi:toxin FitB